MFSQECSSAVTCAVLNAVKRHHKCQLFTWLYFSSSLSLAGWGLTPVFGLRPHMSHLYQLLCVQKLHFQSSCRGIHAAIAEGLCQVRTGGKGWWLKIKHSLKVQFNPVNNSLIPKLQYSEWTAFDQTGAETKWQHMDIYRYFPPAGLWIRESKHQKVPSTQDARRFFVRQNTAEHEPSKNNLPKRWPKSSFWAKSFPTRILQLEGEDCLRICSPMGLCIPHCTVVHLFNFPGN